jgi:hypothetical protein
MGPFVNGSLCDWVLLCWAVTYVMGPLVMGPYEGAVLNVNVVVGGNKSSNYIAEDMQYLYHKNMGNV